MTLYDTFEPVKEATTPEAMRAEIYRLRRRDYLVRSVMDAADYIGASAEDRYTVLAYYALSERAKLLSKLLEFYVVSPLPNLVEPKP